MHSPGFALAYHGCDAEIGEGILKNRDHVFLSENNYDWLGNGAYFWENNPARALQWAEFVKRNPQHFKHRIRKPFVVGAIIDLGNCLDLTDAESLEIVSSGYKVYKENVEQAGSTLPTNDPSHGGDADLVKRFLDCAVINYVHVIRAEQKRPTFDTVRGIFPEGKELYPGAKILSKTHVQICVRQPETSIVAYFRPRSNHC